MVTPVEKDALRIIKQCARSQGISQMKLATAFGVSLITVKRWYSGRGLTIHNLKLLCDYLGLRLSEVFASAEKSYVSYYYYTLEQEVALASDLQLLAFFDVLIGGSRISQIKKKYTIGEYKIVSMLAKLDRLGLIELFPNNRFKFIKSGEPRWNQDGPLIKKYRTQMIEQFLGTHEKPQSAFFIHDYLDADAEQIKKKLQELREFLYLANGRAKYSPDEANSYGVYFSFKKFEWDIRNLLNKN